MFRPREWIDRIALQGRALLPAFRYLNSASWFFSTVAPPGSARGGRSPMEYPDGVTTAGPEGPCPAGSAHHVPGLPRQPDVADDLAAAAGSTWNSPPGRTAVVRRRANPPRGPASSSTKAASWCQGRPPLSDHWPRMACSLAMAHECVRKMMCQQQFAHTTAGLRPADELDPAVWAITGCGTIAVATETDRRAQRSFRC